jgi:HPt (histidine-containing phosphotransfer) domain-containing protein
MSSHHVQSLDAEAIENLRALGEPGDDTFLKEILAIYLDDVPGRLADLKAARDAADRPLYVRSAHTIKGSSANVGATEVRALAEKLEQRAKVEPLTELNTALAELEVAFGRAALAIRTLL